MRKLLLLPLMLAVSLGAFGQASPYNLNVFKAQSFTATGQTGATIQLNGLVIPSTVGSSYASGTITLTGVALTTVSFQVMGSSDNGATFYPLPIYTSASPTTTPATTITATAAGLYQINLAGISHIKFVTTGTFTATSVSLTLTGSPNALVSRNGSGSGGSGTVNSGSAGQLAYYIDDGTAVNGTNGLPNGITATTQSTGDNSAKVATDAFVIANQSGFTAGGDLSGTSTSQTVAGIQGHALPTLVAGYPHWNGSSWVYDTPSGSTVNVNGSAVSTPNFNSFTPAPPAGNTNCTFQVGGSSVSCYVPNSGATTVDILSEQKASGTPFFSKNEYMTVTSGTTYTLLSQTGSGYVNSFFLATEAVNNLITGTISIYVNGDSTPNITMPVEYFTDSVYLPAATNPIKNRFFGYNGTASFGAVYANLSIPFNSGIIIKFTATANDNFFFYTISGQTVADSFPDTEKLWANGQEIDSPAQNTAETLLNYAGANPGRYVGLTMVSDSFPHSLSPVLADLEGNVRIYKDTFTKTWAASTAYSLNDTIVDQNGNLETITTAGTSGTGSEPTFCFTQTGCTTTDGSAAWTMTVGQPPNIWRASASYPTVGAMAILDPNGNVEVVTAAGTSSATEPTFPAAPCTAGTTTIDNTLTWTCSPGTTMMKAAYQSSGTEDYFLQGFYGANVAVPSGNNPDVGMTFTTSNTRGFYRFHFGDPIRFNHSIAVLRQTGDSSEVPVTSGSARIFATAYWYTQDTN